MAFLNHIDVSECEALHRDNGTVTAVNDSNYTLDVKIGDVTYEGVDIHYHCRDSWVAQNHPHSNTYKEEMLGVFKVDDAVLVMCEDDGTPVYVIGFPDGPRPCGGVIVLFAASNGSYDYWNWSLSEEAGVHEDPNFPFPTIPLITSLWWSCNNLIESEYYTQLTPALFNAGNGNCSDSCGLIDFDDDECCGVAANVDDENSSWNVCPCGGDTENGCEEELSCSGGTWVEGRTDKTKTFTYGGCPSSSSRSGSTSKQCDGYSWKVNTSIIDSEMGINRTVEQGNEAKDVCVLQSAVCGPYLVRKDCCDDTNCSAPGDPYNCGGPASEEYYECREAPMCSRWIESLPGGWAHLYTPGYRAGGGAVGGCLECECRATDSSYRDIDGILSFDISAAGKDTSFPGSFSESYLAEAASTRRRQTYGYESEEGGFLCQSCETGVNDSDNEDYASFTYNESSYGIGWSMMVARDDRFSVLLPKLSLAVSGRSIDGTGETVIVATTSIMLRIVGDNEYTFQLATETVHAVVSSTPTSRDGVGIKPSCSARDYLPYDISLRGYHWINDSVLFVAFILAGDFYAYLFEESDSVWTQTRLTSFESFVAQNNLEDYTMYLGGL